MKYILIFFLFFSSLYAKDCYKDKVLDQFICYYKYFNTNSLYAPKESETYYQTKNGSVYALSDEIEVQFNAIGLIFSVIEDFDLELVDKKDEKSFLFKIKDKDKLFSVMRRLNDLTSIKRVIPQRKRKFTTAEVQRRLEVAKKEQKRAVISEKQKEIQKAKEREALKNSGASFKGNFLKGNK